MNYYYQRWLPLVDRMERTTIRYYYLARPDSQRLVKKVHGQSITLVEAMKLKKRMEKVGILWQ